MAENYVTSKYGQLSSAWSRGRRETESRIRRWTAQNEITGVLGRMTTEAASRILNSREKIV